MAINDKSINLFLPAIKNVRKPNQLNYEISEKNKYKMNIKINVNKRQNTHSALLKNKVQANQLSATSKIKYPFTPKIKIVEMDVS